MADSDRLIALFKIGLRSHMEELLNEGHVFMNTVGHFAALEDGSPRSDADEGTRYCKNADGAILSMQRNEGWVQLGELKGPIRFHDDALRSMNLYCLHGRTASDTGKPFRLSELEFGDTFVLFTEFDEFRRRLEQAVAAEGQSMTWNIVDYVDRASYTGPMGVFRKFSERAVDREVRIVVEPGLGRPLSLRLGSLSDIALIGKVTDHLKLESRTG